MFALAQLFVVNPVFFTCRNQGAAYRTTLFLCSKKNVRVLIRRRHFFSACSSIFRVFLLQAFFSGIFSRAVSRHDSSRRLVINRINSRETEVPTFRLLGFP